MLGVLLAGGAAVSAPTAPLAPDPAPRDPDPPLSPDKAAELILGTLASRGREPTPEAKAWVVSLRAEALAEGREWPPPVTGSLYGSDAPRPPLVTTAPPQALAGCSAGAGGIPCVRLRRPRVRCSCGATTRVAPGVVGPQMLVCECGPGLICAHPPGTAPPTQGAIKRAALERRRQQLDELGPREPEKPTKGKARKAKPHRSASAGRRRRRARGSGS